MKFFIIKIWILIFLFLIGCDQNQSNKERIKLGKKIYYSKCHSCHSSPSIPNLTYHSLEINDIINQIKYGNGKMPSFINQLSDKEIDSVAYYIFSNY
tara:strand:+ start:188 stop:478 length:291 start_codon:yes stop_codon:yes gene_type:complete